MFRKFCFPVLAFNGLMIVLLGMMLCCFRVEGTLISEKKVLEVRRKIDCLKSNSVKTIQSEDGDIFYCIDIHKQPAFDHPALRNHTIQKTPSYDPATNETNEWKGKKEVSSKTVTMPQIWRKNGSCPEGTIPVRRPREKELLKLNSIADYGRKQPSFHSPDTQLGKENNPNLQQINRSMAILLTTGFSYSGVKADIKVWNPFVESDDEYSTSQVRLKSGPHYDFESIESGWAVNPSVYGDRQTRLFVYWTVDASKTTGCFDVTCPGFVQTSSEVALGAAVHPVSVPLGLPYQITMYILKDPVTNNWWVQYGESIYLGYWPANLFTWLQHGNAESAEWGGEVYSSKLGRSPHTKTDMGSGRFPVSTESSGAMTRMRVRENSMILKFPEWVSTFTDEYRCYDVWYHGDYVVDPEFYYGGPGQNPMCP